MKLGMFGAIALIFFAQSIAAQKLKITYSLNNSVITRLEFGHRKGVEFTGVTVDSTSPVMFDIFPARGTSLAADWVKVAAVKAASVDCSTVPANAYQKYPNHVTATTPAFLCIADEERAPSGYYPGFLYFTIGGKLAAQIPTELVIFPIGYLQIGTAIGDGALEGKTFNYSVTGTAPAPQSVYATVEAGGPQTTQFDGTKLSYARYDATGSTADWITVQAFDAKTGAATTTPLSPALFKISIDPSRVPPGETALAGYVQFDSTTDKNNKAYVGESFIVVSATVAPPPAVLSADVSQIRLSYPNGQLQQDVHITSNGTAVPFTVSAQSSDGTGWLTSSISSGTTPATITAKANVDGSRPVNSYSGTLTITPTDSRIAPLTVAAQLDVVKPAATLVFAPASLSFSCVVGSRAQDQTLRVTSSDGSGVAFSYRLNSIVGVSADGSVGTTPATLTLHGNCSNLMLQTYRGDLTFTEIPANIGVPTQSVPLSLTGTAALTLITDLSSLRFSGVAGGPTPAAQQIKITSSDGSIFAVTATALTQSGGNWLSVLPSGTTGQPLTVSVNSGGVPPGTYAGQITVAAPSAANQAQVAVQLVMNQSNQPVITGVSSSATGKGEVAPGTFFSVYGANFASGPATWDNFIVNDQLPTQVLDVQVKVNNQNAFIYFVNDKQINAIVPEMNANGTVQVEVDTKAGTASTTVPMKSYSPALFPQFLGGKAYATAIIVGESTLTLAAPVGAALGYRTRPARPGDTLLVYATGLGPTAPQYPDGTVLRQAYPLADPSRLVVRIGNVVVPLQYAGVISAGLYQINLVIPQNVADGDQPITLEIGSESSPSTVYLTVQR